MREHHTGQSDGELWRYHKTDQVEPGLRARRADLVVEASGRLALRAGTRLTAAAPAWKSNFRRPTPSKRLLLVYTQALYLLRRPNLTELRRAPQLLFRRRFDGIN